MYIHTVQYIPCMCVHIKLITHSCVDTLATILGAGQHLPGGGVNSHVQLQLRREGRGERGSNILITEFPGCRLVLANGYS